MYEPPAAIAVTPPLSPATSTAVERSIVVPSPSWPWSFWPQHFTAPPLVSAQRVTAAVGDRDNAACETRDFHRRPAGVASPTLDGTSGRESAQGKPGRKRRHAGAQAGNVGRREAIVEPPALDAARARKGTADQAARRDRGNAATEADDVHGRQAIDLCPVAELALSVVAPALDTAGVQEGAGAVVAARDRRHAAAQTDHVDRAEAPVGCSVTQCAAVVGPPALDAAGARDRAAVTETGGNRGHPAAQSLDIDRGPYVVTRSPAADFVVSVVAPALDAACMRQRARVVNARGDRYCVRALRGRRRA